MSCVLRCRDSATQTNVVLVGTMHGNPVSIDLARSTVCEAAERGALSSVLLEACPTRWERTLATKPKGSLMRRLFDDEMQAAAEAAESYGVAMELVDQPVETTVPRLRSLLLLTLRQLLTPWAGGWMRIAEDYRRGIARLQPDDDVGIGLADLLEDGVVRNTPLTLLRSPVVLGLIAVTSLLVAAVGLPDEATMAALADDLPTVVTQVPITPYTPHPTPHTPRPTPYTTPTTPHPSHLAFTVVTQALGIALLLLLLLGRASLVGLMEERDAVLARNIRRACQGERGREVVVVLGAAHVNGVRRLLIQS